MPERQAVDDVVIVVPGITGTELVKDGRTIWGLGAEPLARGALSRGRSAAQLVVHDVSNGDGVRPGAVIRGVHGLPGVWTPKIGYGHLLDRLQQAFTLQFGALGSDPVPNLLAFGYDWRLSNARSAAELSTFLQAALNRWREAGHPEARVVLVAHSMGGLVAQCAVSSPQIAALVRRVVTLGTPYRGSLKALLTLVNGIALPGWTAPLRVRADELTAMARSLPALYELLPRYDAVHGAKGLGHHRDLDHPGLDTHLLVAADAFHESLWGDRHSADGVTGTAGENGAPGRSGVDLRVLHGMNQRTPTTALVEGDRLRGENLIDGVDEGGDGTVPRLASRPPEWEDLDARRSGHVEQHGALPSHPAVFEKLWELFTGLTKTHRGPQQEEALSVQVPDLVVAGEEVPVEVTAVTGASSLKVLLEAREETGALVWQGAARNEGGGCYRAVLPPAPPGVLRIHVAAATRHGAPATTGVTALALVWA